MKMSRALHVLTVLAAACGVLALEGCRCNGPDLEAQIGAVRIERRDSSGDVSRFWYATDRLRCETSSGFVGVVHLGRGEVYIWRKGSGVCTVYSIAEAMARLQDVDTHIIGLAEASPEWQDDLEDLKRVIEGDFEGEVSGGSTRVGGYDCRHVEIAVGTVLRSSTYVTHSNLIPANAGDMNDALAAVVGARFLGSSAVNYKRLRRGIGNLVVQEETIFRLPDPQLSLEVSSRLESVKRCRVARKFFEIPEGRRVEHWKQ